MKQCGKLSIIVPAFNGEVYISRCLDSLIDCRPLEIIIVDDCSTDGTRHVCNQYAEQYKDIYLICNDTNKGVTYSRNLGLCHAMGSYVTFVDADDWVEKSFLKKAESIMDENENVDVVVGKMYSDNGKGKRRCIVDFHEEKKLSKKDAVEELFLWNYYRWEMCGKIYRKKLFLVWKPDFSIKVCEDLDCTWQIFQTVNYVLALLF